jgi:hypothetical protein
MSLPAFLEAKGYRRIPLSRTAWDILRLEERSLAVRFAS